MHESTVRLLNSDVSRCSSPQTPSTDHSPKQHHSNIHKGMRKVANLRKITAKWSSISVACKDDLDLDKVAINDNNNHNDICRIQDSPFYAHKLASRGNVEELQQLLESDRSRATAHDTKGWTCLHHAAKTGRQAVIDLLLEYEADMEAVDNEGLSALHTACMFGQSATVRHLIIHGADAAHKHKGTGQTPLFFATRHNKPAVIDVLAEFAKDKVDMNATYCNGANALHLAASKDFPLAAEALLRGGTKLCQPCDNGFYPIHTAAKNAASSVLEIFLNHGESIGYSREHMLGFSDAENNSPLHTAVNSGDLEAVKVLLQHGARVDSRQTDNSTAFHFASSQGTLELVQAMYEAHLKAWPDTAEELLFATDVLGMTPLHRASMFDHSATVKYLIDKGSDVNAKDAEHRSPLMLSAMRGGSATMQVLLAARADVTVRDKLQRSVLHYIVSYSGARMAVELNVICKTDAGQKLLNERDNLNGMTPLHLASKRGQLRFLDSLLQLGANLSTKDNQSQSALHFAAKYGRVNTVRLLLENRQGTNVINEADGHGLTALHTASANGHEKVVQLLLNKGALLHRDFSGRSPLHLAAENGYTETMRKLLSVHANLLNLLDRKGNTALHLAARSNKANAATVLLDKNCELVQNNDGYLAIDICIENRHTETASALAQHSRWRDIVKTCSPIYKCPLMGLIQYLPEVHKIVLDNCHTYASGDPNDKCYWEKYDFSMLQVDHNILAEMKNKSEMTHLVPLMALNYMVKFGQIDLLSHPVCLTYLRKKWTTYGFPLHCMNMFLYLVFIACLTFTVVSVDPRFSHIDGVARPLAKGYIVFNEMGASDVLPLNSSSMKHYYAGDSLLTTNPCAIIVTWVLIGMLLLNIMKELVQIYQERFGYLFDVVNYLEWSLYITAAVYVGPIALYGRVCELQWQCGAVAIFLAWFNLLIYLQRLDSVGIYVIMFLHILKTVIRVTLVFSVLFIAFGLTFFILLASARPLEPLNGPVLAVLDSVVMMMGDLRYSSLYSQPYLHQTMMYPGLNFVFLILFVLLVPILFINLLIGLAVGDIEMVQKNAKLRRLAMQVNYHTELEERWLPRWLLVLIDNEQLTVYPNAVCFKGSFFKHPIKTILGYMHEMSSSASFSIMHNSVKRTEQVADQQLHQDIEKTKKRLRDIQSRLDQQYDLIRLIVQKMEITSEANDYDEGDNEDKKGFSKLCDGSE